MMRFDYQRNPNPESRKINIIDHDARNGTSHTMAITSDVAIAQMIVDALNFMDDLGGFTFVNLNGEEIDQT